MKHDGQLVNERYDNLLAPYAQHSANTRGRTHTESPDPHRTPYQRDRARIIHSHAWRRLKGKMQVVPPDHGDHYRTRLTHTIEVASISRDIARQLRLNEDLAEVIALAHDLGHPPFGHSGEEALQTCLEEHDVTFEHNQQSLRIVTKFEQRYPHFRGLNLTHEVLQGLRKHDDNFMNTAGERIYSPHLEAQLVDIADEIAYLAADLEDALRGAFFTLGDVMAVPLVRDIAQGLDTTEPNHRSTLVRWVIHTLIIRLVNDSKANLQRAKVQKLADVQQHPHRLITFTKAHEQSFLELKAFLRKHYYYAPSIKQGTDAGQQIIKDLFAHYKNHPDQLPPRMQNSDPLPRRIADYIAGMTDDYAQREHARITMVIPG